MTLALPTARWPGLAEGHATLIADGQKRVLTPIGWLGLDDDGHLIVGEAAKARLVSHPALTHASFKRYMGTDKIFALGEHRFRAEELSALVLRKLKADAEVGAWLSCYPRGDHRTGLV
ncbi:Hsc62 [Cronobacter sakazakii]|nr:Hsc62 [Cronobacter sakazakii]